MDTVRILLAKRETKAWYSFGGIIPAQDLAYVFCQDLLAARLNSAKVISDVQHCKSKE